MKSGPKTAKVELRIEASRNVLRHELVYPVLGIIALLLAACSSTATSAETTPPCCGGEYPIADGHVDGHSAASSDEHAAPD